MAATELDAAARQADIIQQRQQQQIQQDKEEAQREIRPGGADLKSLVPATPAASGSTGKCHEIQSIEIIDAHRLTGGVRQQINLLYAGKCLGVDEISQILGLITKNYIEQGYVTTRAYLPAQDLKSGHLKIVVIEGRIGKFQIEDGGANSVSVNNAFTLLQGGVLNLRDLEQGVDQINRLQSNNAKLDIQPGDDAGDSVVVIRNQPSFPVHLFTTYDNQGAKSTGQHQGAATVTFDGLAGFNESFMASHRESMPLEDKDHSSKSDAFSFNIPFGYNLFSLDLNRSRYVNVLTLQSGANAVAEGNNRTNSFSWNRVVFRDQSSRLSFGVGLTTKDSRNYFAEQYLDVSSRKLSVLDLRSSYSTAIRTVFVQMDLGYARGLTEFGAMHDSPILPSDQPHAQFQKATARLYAKVPFEIAGQSLSYDSELNLQQAWNPLYGSEQILIGGIYSVRGFVNNSLSGDKGYYWRNEVALPKNFNLGSQAFSGKIYAGVDFGRVWNLAALPGGRLAGATVGLQGRWRGLIVDLSHSSTISLPSGMTRESAQTWFRISAAL